MLRVVLSAKRDLPIAYHNVAEFENGRQGLTLQRIPRAWRERLPERTAFRATQAAGVEEDERKPSLLALLATKLAHAEVAAVKLERPFEVAHPNHRVEVSHRADDLTPSPSVCNKSHGRLCLARHAQADRKKH